MQARGFALTVLVLGCLLFLVFTAVHLVAATPAVVAPSAESAALLTDRQQPIAGPDGQALVNGWSVLMFKDRKTGECYVAFSRGSAIAAANASTCPQPPR